MDQADSVLSTPPTNTSADNPSADSTQALETGLAIQQRDREAALHEVARLRKVASAEIERLLAFMDASDPYTSTELEVNGDEMDASYPESGVKACSPNEDDEDGADDEPSIGSVASREWQSQTQWGAGNRSDMEEEHDGREQDSEDEGAATGDDEPSAGFDHGINEPSLGWTDHEAATGSYTGWGELTADLEDGMGAVTPQKRTTIAGPLVSTEHGFADRRQLSGLTEAQEKQFKQAMAPGANVGIY